MNILKSAIRVSQVSRFLFASLKKHTLPQLKFAYNGLEPIISATLLEFHHSKHHQAYVTNLNLAQEQLEDAIAKNDLQRIVTLNSLINFNYGGHYNHTFFWENLFKIFHTYQFRAPVSQGGGQLPGNDSPLTQAVKQTWGSYDALIADFSARTTAIQGSGWGWIGVDKTSKKLRYVSLPNQELPSSANITPILSNYAQKIKQLAVDVWEHAYWWDYKNVRPNFLKNIWQVVNWKDVEAKYVKATQN